VKIYLAGPLFSPAQRNFLDDCALRLRGAGLECFVPHQESGRLDSTSARSISARSVFDLDYREGIAKANALVAWLDGPTVDDGTACEIGIYYGLLQQGVAWRKGILGLVTDLRLQRRRDTLEHGGLNLFLAGTIESAGAVCWSLDEVIARLLAWRAELDGGR
jgi:nucleoside 2-deoxyribosyltransferase